jgi:hypothetical protein
VCWNVDEPFLDVDRVDVGEAASDALEIRGAEHEREAMDIATRSDRHKHNGEEPHTDERQASRHLDKCHRKRNAA